MSAGTERRVLLLGGTSEIGLAIVHRAASEGPVRALLLGRDRARLAAAARDLVRGGCTSAEFDLIDADDIGAHGEALSRAFDRMDRVDLVVLAIGVLGAQAGLEAPRDEVAEVMRVNFLGCGSLLIEALRCLQRQRRGTLVVLSSVAGERVRATNAIYGAAKAGLDALAQGLGDAVASSGVRVLIVRPGFVATRMTAGLDPAPMATTPQAVADAVIRALPGRAHTIWVPSRLQLIFAVLRHLPRALFRKLPG